jgi:hypothetical protein
MKIWACKIGESEPGSVPQGADLPMRKAVAAAYREVTGNEPAYCFSGWAAELDEGERAVVEKRLPNVCGDVPKAMDTVTMALRNDAGYRVSWVANIAMAIHDTKRLDGETEVAWLNRGAEAFIELLSRPSREV